MIRFEEALNHPTVSVATFQMYHEERCWYLEFAGKLWFMHRIFNIRYSSSKLYNTGEFLVGILSQFLDDAFQDISTLFCKVHKPWTNRVAYLYFPFSHLKFSITKTATFGATSENSFQCKWRRREQNTYNWSFWGIFKAFCAACGTHWLCV